MPDMIKAGFLSYDAGKGGGALDKSTTFEIDSTLFEDQKEAVPFNPWGSQRKTEYPGLIGASRFIGRYLPSDTSDQNYEDMIAACDDDTLQTVVIRKDSGVAATTNHQVTVTFYHSKHNTGGMAHGSFVFYPVDGMIQSVVEYDGTTTYTR